MAALLVAVAIIAVSACGSDDPAPASAGGPNPVPATTLDPGAFANLPKPASARVLDDPVEKDGVITQSFLVSGLGPTGVIDYYAQTLPEADWVAAGVSAKGSTTLRSKWLRGESRLQVTAFSEDGVQSPGPTQLDLQLHLA